MTRRIQSHIALCVLFVGCAPAPRDDTPARGCRFEAGPNSQGLAVIQPELSFVVWHADGDEIVCTPSADSLCDDVYAEACTATVVGAIGEVTPFEIGLQASSTRMQIRSVSLDEGSDPSLTVASAPTEASPDAMGIVRLELAPLVVGTVSGTLIVATDAPNQFAGYTNIGILAEAVE